MYPPPAPGQHDTTAIPRPYPPAGTAGYAPDPGPGYAPGYGPAPAYGPGYGPGQPTPDAWEAKYRRQRTRTRVAVAFAALTTVVALALGVAAWQVSQSPLFSAASELASGGLDLDGITPPTSPEGATPDGATPEGTTPDAQVPDGLDVPLSELPIPDSLKSLASAVGITDVGQLLDLAVANGIMTQEDADTLRAGIAAGALANGLAEDQSSQ